MAESPYRPNPPPGAMPRWFYWSPAHWRRWQVIGVTLLAIGALGRRAGCCAPPPEPAALRTYLGKPGWRVTVRNQIELNVVAGRLCATGGRELTHDYGNGPFSNDNYIIQCDAPGDRP